MPGITSLGIGSSAGLTGETITKLKNSDTQLQVKPIEKKMAEYEQKQESLSQLITVLHQAKDFSSNLRDDLLYLQRGVVVTGEGVTAYVEGGVEPQKAILRYNNLQKGISFSLMYFHLRLPP